MTQREQKLFRENEELRTRLKEAEDALSAVRRDCLDDHLLHSKGILEEAQRIANLGSWEYDFTTSKVSWSKQLYRIYQKDPASYTPSLENLYKLIHPADRVRIKELITLAIHEKCAYESEYRILLNDGDTRYIHSKAKVITNSSTEAIMMVGTSQDITERRILEEAARFSENKIRGILDASRESIWMFSPEGIILLVNPTACQRFGKSEPELIGKYVEEVLPDNLARSRMERLREVVKTALPVEFEDERAEMFFRHSFYPVTDENGFVTSVVSFSRDITGERQADVILRNTFDRFYLMLSSMYAGVLLMTNEGDVEFLNKAFCDFYHLKEKPAELIGISSQALLKKIINTYKDPENAATRILEIIRNMQPVRGEEFELQDGQTAIRDFIPLKIHGKSSGRLWIHTDITDRKKAEDALLKNEKLLKSVLDNVSSGVALIDDKGQFSVFNPLFLKLFGLTENSTIKNVNDQNWAEWQVFNENGTLLDVDDHPVRKAAMTGKLVEHQLVGVKVPAGEDITWMLISAEPIHKENGSIDKIICTYHDVTALRKVSEELRQSREQLAAVFNGVSETLMLLDIDGTILISNRIFDKRFNLGNSNAVGKSIFDFVPDRFHEKRKKQIEELVRTKKPVTFLDTINETFLELTFYPVFDDHGNVKQFISSALDITERKKMEETLLKSERDLSDLYTSMSEGLAIHELLFDSSGKAVDYVIREVNPAYERITGLSRDSALGRKATDLYSVSEAPYLETYAEVESSGIPVSFETFFSPINKYFMVSVFTPGKGKFATVFQDITVRKLADEAVLRKNETMEGINRVLAATLTSTTEEELGTKCLEVIQEITRSKFGFIGEMNDSGLEDIAISNPGWEACNILDGEGHRAPVKGFKIHGIYGQVLMNGSPLITNDPGNHPASIGLPPGHPPLEAFLGVPLKYEGRTIGIIAVANRPGGYTLSDQESIEAIAPAIVEAFMRKRSEEAARVSEREKTKLAAILGLSSQPFAVGYPDGTMGYMNREFENLTGYTAEELKKISWEKDLTPPEYHEMEKVYLNYLMETGTPVRYEKEYIRKNGTRVPIELLVSTMTDAEGKPEYFYTFLTDITERKKSEYNLRQLIRTLSAMQKSSLLMAQANDEIRFLQDVCKIIIDDCGHKMVWIGYKEDDHAKSVRPVAYAGFEDDYLETLKITWDDSERGRGPTGTAIRTGKPALCRNMHTDPAFGPWRKEALKRGYSSSIVLPLRMDDEVFGAVTIYSREPDPFSSDEQQLLTKLADDLAYGIKAIRLNIALKQSKASLEVKVKERTSMLRKAMDDLEAERQRFLDVLNMLPVYVALIAPDFRVRYTNKVFKENFGEPEGRMCYDLLFGRKEMCEDCRNAKVPDKDKPSQREAVGCNGRIFQISDFSFTDIDGVQMILEMGSDITEKKEIEKFVLSKIMETEERDRRRFAGDLHDDLGPTLSAVKLQLNLLSALNSDNERKQLLSVVDQLLSESVEKMRNLANAIMPGLIFNFGLETALNSFINKVEKSSMISFRIHSNLNGYRFDEETELHLYRILTELVNNTLKHSGASEVSLDMHLSEKVLRITYWDNGKGYNFEKISVQPSGIGLQNIQNRTNLIGGSVSFKIIDQKTVVSINVPV